MSSSIGNSPRSDGPVSRKYLQATGESSPNLRDDLQDKNPQQRITIAETGTFVPLAMHVEHIMTKNGWNDWIFHSIDWDAQAKALNTLQYTQELFVTKWAYNLLPTRRHMQRIGKAESDLCPSCLETKKRKETQSPEPANKRQCTNSQRDNKKLLKTQESLNNNRKRRNNKGRYDKKGQNCQGAAKPDEV